ncbi:hypothetical protein ES708_14733 [subsurface metagenome]
MWIRKVFRSGNSLVVALPKVVKRTLNVHSGSTLLMRLDGTKKVSICAIDDETLERFAQGLMKEADDDDDEE